MKSKINTAIKVLMKNLFLRWKRIVSQLRINRTKSPFKPLKSSFNLTQILIYINMPNKLRDCANRYQWHFNKCLRNTKCTVDDLCCISCLYYKSECYTVTSRSLDSFV